MRVYKIASFSVVLLLIVVLFAGAVAVPAAAQNDAVQFQHNAQHTGDYSPVAGSNMSNGKLTWSYTTGLYVGGVDHNIYAIGNATAATSQGTTPGFDIVLVFAGLVFAGLVIVAYAVKAYR